ncbi:MAG: gene transfer agent family protein [Alphaproteobacteria bacterium]|nr:gene transfer agent family protein [Alphaproteobacteria bacterium]
MTPIVREFGGTERTFEIKPASVPMFEAAIGKSLYALIRSFTAGDWRFDDVAKVISFAGHGPTTDMRRQWGMVLQAAKMGLAMPPLPYCAHPEVVDILTKDGHGNYAELAAEILTAAVFGDEPEGGADEE